MSAQAVLFDKLGPRGRRTATLVNIVGAVVVLGILAFGIVQLNQAGQSETNPNGQLSGRLWAAALGPEAWTGFYLPGLQNTLLAAAYSIVLALVLGLALGVGRLASNRAVRWFCGTVVEFFRAVPVLIMMVAGAQLGYNLGLVRNYVPLVAVVVGLTLYNGSVIAELVRSGVHNLPKGQREAGLAVGMTRGQSIRSIELPQALIAMLPSLVSQFVIVLKDSALGQIILYNELLRSATLLGSGAPFPVLQTLFVAAMIFIVINFVLTWAAQRLARKLSSRTSGRTRAAAPAATVEVGSGTG